MERHTTFLTTQLDELESSAYNLRLEAQELEKKKRQLMGKLEEFSEEVGAVKVGKGDWELLGDKIEHTDRLLRSIGLKVEVARDKAQAKAHAEMQTLMDRVEHAVDAARTKKDLDHALRWAQESANACDPSSLGPSDHHVESAIAGCCKEDRVYWRKAWKAKVEELKARRSGVESVESGSGGSGGGEVVVEVEEGDGDGDGDGTTASSPSHRPSTPPTPRSSVSSHATQRPSLSSATVVDPSASSSSAASLSEDDGGRRRRVRPVRRERGVGRREREMERERELQEMRREMEARRREEEWRKEMERKARRRARGTRRQPPMQSFWGDPSLEDPFYRGYW